MEFQALTGSVAFALTQAAVALFMFGLYLAARRDPCTRYWSIASALVAIGVILPFPFIATGLSLAAIWLGTSAIVAGLIWMWQGTRVFFDREPKLSGWALAWGHALFVAALFMASDQAVWRIISFAVAVTVAVSLIMFEIVRGDGKPMTIARRLVVFAYAITLAPVIIRASILLATGRQMTPLTDSTLNVAMLYLLPMAGGLLSSVGMLLMYFERTIDEKDYLANHDELTRLYNRRALTEAGKKALAACASRGTPVTLLLIDIDHFKSVNDTLGHEAGDRALVLIAEALAGTCRGTDTLGRHGGEEFCVVCPDTSVADAQALSERLLRAVATMILPGEFERALSISIGLAEAYPSENVDWDALVNRADKALYAAKANGRDQVVVSARA
ncbi:GGDEF domain-containing protein [Iodidimonas sp. SYSU 1G8]|uniref:GGDEF domain-containing protein n=1 Tax=Iodidimonas sp. SYSU 1G8 TaxID=3133967 RepID=UPI0031FE8E8E